MIIDVQNRLDALEAMRHEVSNIMPLTIGYFEAEIVDLVMQSQLKELGQTGEGVDIASYDPYDTLYAAFKRSLGLPANKVTLFLTGDFHAGGYIVMDETSFYLWSTDYKTKDLVIRYGAQILKPSVAARKYIQDEFIRPQLSEILKKYRPWLRDYMAQMLYRVFTMN